jgi:CheY-like chemotaxis protein
MPKVAVLCWEESRPWVSALRQQGYSVPWVDEPKGESYKQIPTVEPDVVLVDLTRLPDRGREMVIHLADQEDMRGVPIVLVSERQTAARGLKTRVDPLIVTTPTKVVDAVTHALAATRA